MHKMHKMDKMEKKTVLKCEECGFEQTIPMHCGKQMHLEKVEGKEMLVCWMGPGCGKQSIPEHHGKSMKISN